MELADSLLCAGKQLPKMSFALLGKGSKPEGKFFFLCDFLSHIYVTIAQDQMLKLIYLMEPVK